MDVLASVKEASGSDGDVVHFVTVERKGEGQGDGGGAAVRLGQHGVLLHLGRGGRRAARVQRIQIDPEVIERNFNRLVVTLLVLQKITLPALLCY
jgi:hypothetical protein